MGIQERFADDSTERNQATPHRDILIDCFFEQRHIQMLAGTLHDRIRAEDASRMAEIGNLDL
jgi:hypothetical protein